ncbi:hypothetical protein KCP77_01020 [Salmonella enterica subsp. enterica]|nr:hypothetical protein KCP77_01020 [Salmonella enterica subsp. enterica]
MLFPYFAVSVNCCATARISTRIDKVMEKQFGWRWARPICWMLSALRASRRR